jgi:hypothetical protein
MFGALECDFNDQSLGRCNVPVDVAFVRIVVVIDVVKDNDDDDDVSKSEARDNNIDLPIKMQYKTNRTATIHLIFMPIFAAGIFILCAYIVCLRVFMSLLCLPLQNEQDPHDCKR